MEIGVGVGTEGVRVGVETGEEEEEEEEEEEDRYEYVSGKKVPAAANIAREGRGMVDWEESGGRRQKKGKEERS